MCKVLVAYFKDVSSPAAIKAYKMLLYLHERNRRTWASSVCYVLYRYGFDKVWENQGVGDEFFFLKEFKDRLLTLYKQEWVTSLRTNDRFSFYSTFKSNLSLSPYLNDLKHVKARNFLVRIRLGVSPLKIHKLRFATSTTQANLVVRFAEMTLKQKCILSYLSKRQRNPRTVHSKRKWYNCPSSFRLTLLLATSSGNIYIQSLSD